METSWRRLQERTRLLSNAVCHKVRIGIGSRALSSGVFELTAAFFNCHPETEVTYLLDIGDQVTQALEERRMDLAIDRLPPEEIEPRREHIIALSCCGSVSVFCCPLRTPGPGCWSCPSRI